MLEGDARLPCGELQSPLLMRLNRRQQTTKSRDDITSAERHCSAMNQVEGCRSAILAQCLADEADGVIERPGDQVDRSARRGQHLERLSAAGRGGGQIAEHKDGTYASWTLTLKDRL